MRSRTASWAAGGPTIRASSRRRAAASCTCTGSSAGCAPFSIGSSANPPTGCPQPLLDTATRIAQHLDAHDADVVALQQQARLLQDEISSKLAERTNRQLYVLSVIAALLLPPSVVAGIFGMNVGGLPMLDSPYGFVTTLLLIAASPFLVYVALRLSGVLRA
jgi:zinc transporter